MRWLLTVKASIDLSELRSDLDEIGVTMCPDDEIIPLDDGDELVLGLEGPPDLEVKLTSQPGVVMLSPDSEMGYFASGPR